jgi:hypothetical protein
MFLVQKTSDLSSLTKIKVLLTLNNELLYYYYDLLCQDNVAFTIDSFFLTKYLNIRGTFTEQVVGVDIYEYLRLLNYRCVIIGGNDLLYSSVDLHPFIRVDTPLFTNSADLQDWLVINRSLFENYEFVLVMFTGWKQKVVMEFALSECLNVIFIGLGGTLDQICNYKSTPVLFRKSGLEWLYRTIWYFDKTKFVKLILSFYGFRKYGYLYRLINEKK